MEFLRFFSYLKEKRNILQTVGKKGIFEKFRSLFIRYETIPPDMEDLTSAILMGDHSEVKRIIEFGLNPDHADDLGRLPLHFAAIKNKPEIIEVLVESGAEINLLDKDGNTALMYSAEADCLESSRKLINLGIDYFLKNNKQQTALDIARNHDHKKVIELFELRANELRLVISKRRNQEAAKYSSLSNLELGIEGAGAGGRTQKKDPSKKEFYSKLLKNKSLPELELELARLEKLLKNKPG